MLNLFVKDRLLEKGEHNLSKPTYGKTGTSKKKTRKNYLLLTIHPTEK